MVEKPLAEMTPAEVDGELATLYEERCRLSARIGGGAKTLERLAEKEAKRGELMPWEERDREETKKKLAEWAAEAEAVAEKEEFYEAEFRRRGGWRRYFLVTSSDGHIHRGMHCETCYTSTRYAWLPTLSDCVEEEMVERYGMKACTICFPSAPTMPGWLKAEKEAAAEAERKAGTHCSYKTPARGSASNPRLIRRYGTCPECGAKGVSITRLGCLRKHKRPTPKPA